MQVTELCVWADRQVHLGTGANIKIGGSVRFQPTGGEVPATTEFRETLRRVLGIVDEFADQIETNVSMPENWPDKAAKKE